jgi:hypothetical protein
MTKQPTWEKDPTTREHQLTFDSGFYCVYQTAAGDWCGGWQLHDEPSITDETHEYFDTWQAARKYCESLKCHTGEQQ